MADLEEAAKKSPIVTPITVDALPWESRFVVSAARLEDGSMLARVTFSDGTDKASFRLEGKDVSVERPAGKVGTWLRVP